MEPKQIESHLSMIYLAMFALALGLLLNSVGTGMRLSTIEDKVGITETVETSK